jgi:hypothetical protein
MKKKPVRLDGDAQVDRELEGAKVLPVKSA